MKFGPRTKTESKGLSEIGTKTTSKTFSSSELELKSKLKLNL